MQVCVQQYCLEKRRFQVFNQKGICKCYAVKKPTYIKKKFYLYGADNDEQLLCISKSLTVNYGRFKILGVDGNILGKVRTRRVFGGYQEVICNSTYGRIVIKRRVYSDRFKIYCDKDLIGAILQKKYELKYLLDVQNDKYLNICISLVIILSLYEANTMYRKTF